MPRRPSRHIDSPEAVGARLREARERARLSQRNLAFDGCTSGYISRVEAGQRIPSLQILAELAARLGTTADWLAHGAGGEPPDDGLVVRVSATEIDQEIRRWSTNGAVGIADLTDEEVAKLGWELKQQVITFAGPVGHAILALRQEAA